MYIFLAVVAFIIILFIFLSRKYRKQIKFFITGLDSNFTLSEILMLWKLSKVLYLEDPIKLYFSMAALNRSITQLIETSKAKGIEKSTKVQNLLTKLYDYRTKIEIESDKKKGIDSTRELSNGQRLRIILPGSGVFLSEIKNNARELAIKMPVQKGIIKIPGNDWIGKNVNVYLWRKGDASYVFDSDVYGSGVFLGEPVLYLSHTNQLLRTQKRQSIRGSCKIYADLYFIGEDIPNYDIVETEPGYRCLIEDISENGAMIRVGGKGAPDTKIKLQFNIELNLIIMFGIVRAVEYNQKINQSRLHFECIHIDPAMKNIVLSFVYKVLPQNEKEIYDAIALTEEDASNDAVPSASNSSMDAAGEPAGLTEAADGAEIPVDTEELSKEEVSPDSVADQASFFDDSKIIDSTDSYLESKKDKDL